MSEGPGGTGRTPALARLDFMVGEWNTHEDYPPTPWMPEGGRGEGRATIRWTVGGLCLVTDYETRGLMGESFEGHGVMSYDPGAKVYTGHWFDSRTPFGTEGRGVFEGESLVLHYRHESPDGAREIRSVTTPVSESEFRMTGSSLVEGRWIETVRIRYVRA